MEPALQRPGPAPRGKIVKAFNRYVHPRRWRPSGEAGAKAAERLGTCRAGEVGPPLLMIEFCQTHALAISITKPSAHGPPRHPVLFFTGPARR